MTGEEEEREGLQWEYSYQNNIIQLKKTQGGYVNGWPCLVSTNLVWA